MDLLTPRKIPNSALLLHTLKQCNARGPLGNLPSLSLTTKGSWMHLRGRVAKSLVSPLMPVPLQVLELISGKTGQLQQKPKIVVVVLVTMNHLSFYNIYCMN